MTMTRTATELEPDAADRMLKAVRVSGLSIQAIAEHLEVNRNTVGRWLAGRNEPRMRDLKAFAALTGVAPEWIDPERCARRDLNPRPIDLWSIEQLRLAA